MKVGDVVRMADSSGMWPGRQVEVCQLGLPHGIVRVILLREDGSRVTTHQGRRYMKGLAHPSEISKS